MCHSLQSWPSELLWRSAQLSSHLKSTPVSEFSDVEPSKEALERNSSAVDCGWGRVWGWWRRHILLAGKPNGLYAGEMHTTVCRLPLAAVSFTQLTSHICMFPKSKARGSYKWFPFLLLAMIEKVMLKVQSLISVQRVGVSSSISLTCNTRQCLWN